MDNSKPVASRGGGKKGKSSANFPPVTVEYKNEDEIPEDVKKLINNFLNCTSTESQLGVTKTILDSLDQLENDSKENVIKFFVLVLLESEPKHPVKCLLMRQVDQMENIHEIFMKHLSRKIQSYQLYFNNLYPEYAKFVTRLNSCFDNFPLFVKTVTDIALKVFRILFDCISSCVTKLRTIHTSPSSPKLSNYVCVMDARQQIEYLYRNGLSITEKLEVSKVIHQTLHLYLNVYQKATLDENQINTQQLTMSQIMSELVFNDDISMDSKSLCAVIQITMTKSRGKLRDPWLDGYPMGSLHTMSYQSYWMKEESVLLCFYCGLITAAPNDVARRLDFASSSNVAEHILTLIKNVVHITDRLSGSVSVTLCGARGLAAAAGWLNNAGPKGNKSDKSDSKEEEFKSDKNESDSNKGEFKSDKNESDSNKDEFKSDKNESDSNKDEFKSDKNESDSNKEQFKSDKNESDSNKEQFKSDKNESDSNKEQFKSDKNESDSNKEQFKSDKNESDSKDSDIPDPWLFPLEKHEYGEGEVYMGRTLELARVLVRFAERRLQHHVPAVRHLADQIHADVMLYCLRYHPQEVTGWLEVEGGLGRGQMALLRRVGGELLRAVVTPRALLPHLHNDHKQPHVAALLDTYLEKDCSDLNSELVFSRWFPPVLEFVRRPLSSVVTDVLVKLMAKAIDIQDQLIYLVLPLIESPDATTPANLKCTLFLLNVISKSKVSKKYQDSDDKWKGLISYDVLEAAILDDDDERVRLCTCGAWRGCGRGGARLVLAFLRHAAHRPRALHDHTLRALAQFLKHFEKEHRSCIDKERHPEILQKLRSICMSNLVRGANHYRRGIALFVLKAMSGMQLEGNGSEWTLDEVETVLYHLDDSYETNKQMALDILKTCPQTLLREAVSSNNMSSIPSLVEGVSYRVRDAEGAAHKLELLVTALPDVVLAYPGIDTRAEIEPVRYAACAAALHLSRRLPAHRAAALTLLRTQLDRVPLACVGERGEPRLVSEACSAWSVLARRAAGRALHALAGAAPLVEAASPEGHVPPLFFDILVEPHPSQPHLYMVGEETMTAQTMLLSAWTCAKEAWLILGRTSQWLDWGALSQWWVELAACVARARHRAVHDHAAKAYTTILRRISELPQSIRVESVGELAVGWVANADGTRRAAGLAGLVLAIAAAHPDLRYVDVRALADIHRPGAHHAAMALLRARETARAAHDVLPCLVRHALHDADSPDAALQWACVGVVGAGVRRVAGAHAPGGGGGGVAPGGGGGGVAPGGGGGGVAPGERGRLRTSVFISRYPGLYQYILECVDRARVREKSMCASVACSLLLLSRLLPDAGTTCAGAGTTCTGASALHGGVRAACGSASYHTRRLAAAAAAATLPPTMYLEHAMTVLATLSDKDTPKNLCHGYILRLLAFIDEAGELPWAAVFARGLPPTLWVVHSPCFPLVHEYLQLIIVLVQRYPSSIEGEYRSALGAACGRAALGRVLPGAQLCAARALGVAAALLDPPRAAQLISNGLDSTVHEVCLASLECLLSALGEAGAAPLAVAGGVRDAPGAPALVARVARVARAHVHRACRRRALHVLVLERAYEHIIGEEYQPGYGSMETWIIEKLCWYIESCGTEWACPGRGAPPCPRGEALYARALSTHLHSVRAAAGTAPDYRDEPRWRMCVELVSQCAWSRSAGRGGRGTRDAVRDLVREHGAYLATYDGDSLSISLLVVAASARLSEGGGPRPGQVVPPARGQPALLLALALLDFGLEDITDNYQPFDSEIDSELYEEGIWTDRCTDMLIQNYAQTYPGRTITPYILSLIQKHGTLRQVCGIHLVHFEKLLKGVEISNLHDKVELFVSKLKAFDASIQMSC